MTSFMTALDEAEERNKKDANELKRFRAREPLLQRMLESLRSCNDCDAVDEMCAECLKEYEALRDFELQNMTRDDMLAALAGGPLSANAWQPDKEAELQRFLQREPLVQELIEHSINENRVLSQCTAELVRDFKVK